MPIKRELKKAPVKRPNCIILKLIIVMVCIVGVVTTLIFGINAYVCFSTTPYIYSEEDYQSQSADCILVLGCGVKSLTPSLMLRDRLDAAIRLYKTGVAPKLLMSGDHGEENYNEVGVMKAYAIEQGVPAEDIFMDHAGFSTYESLYRVKEIFGCQRVVVVTQKYHLYRALYLGNKLDINISGFSADTVRYAGQTYRDIREILARDKDFITAIIKPVPQSVKGEKIDISGNGNITNDNAFDVIAEQKGIDIDFSLPQG